MHRVCLVKEHFKVESWVMGVGGDEDGMHLVDGRLEFVFLLGKRCDGVNTVGSKTSERNTKRTVRSMTNTIAAKSFHWIGNF